MNNIQDMQFDITKNILGASMSIEILVAHDDIGLLDKILDFAYMPDDRLDLSMLIVNKMENDINISKRNINIIKQFSKSGWYVQETETSYSANALIIDREYVYLFVKIDGQYIINFIEDEQTKNEILLLFINLFDENENTVLFEDILFTSIPQYSTKIISTSTEVWSKIISNLTLDPSEIMNLSPRKFEELVAELLVRENMQVHLTRPTKDGGVDIFAETTTHFGKHLYLVECKHYAKRNKIGVSIVRALYGILEDQNATKGIIVTTSDFTKGANDFKYLHKNRLDFKNYDSIVKWLAIIKKAEN
jgi:HJR/Mrr/RecB family endonuclease